MGTRTSPSAFRLGGGANAGREARVPRRAGYGPRRYADVHVRIPVWLLCHYGREAHVSRWSVDGGLCLLTEQFDGLVHLRQVGIDDEHAFERE